MFCICNLSGLPNTALAFSEYVKSEIAKNCYVASSDKDSYTSKWGFAIQMTPVEEHFDWDVDLNIPVDHWDEVFDLQKCISFVKLYQGIIYWCFTDWCFNDSYSILVSIYFW